MIIIETGENQYKIKSMRKVFIVTPTNLFIKMFGNMKFCLHCK